jgi:hypothetical protein
MITAEVIQLKLKEFHGSEFFYRCLNPNFVMSEGVKYLAEAAECHWLIDALPPYIGRFEKHLAVVELKKSGNQWMLTLADRYGKVRVSELVDYCTFPLPEIRLFVEWSELCGNKWVISLPSEN